jgi:glycosyltransferase involved in cell wall biosynthesis
MKISIVIPTHNRPDFLVETLESVAAQTYGNWEAVVVDDGSSPALALDALKSRLDGKVLLVRHETPCGVAGAKNAGIAAATGEIITILDDDDLLAPTALHAITEAFSARPDLDCLFLAVEPFGPYATGPAENRRRAIDKILLRTHPREANGLYLFDNSLFFELINSVPIDFQRPAARRGAWNIVGGFDETGLFSEAGWAIRASTMCKLALTRQPVTYWRIHGANFGWPSDLNHDQAVRRQIDNDVESAKALLAHLHRKELEVTKQVRSARRRLAECYFNKAYFLRDKDKSTGLKNLLYSVAVSPRPKYFKLLFRYFLRGSSSEVKHGHD